MKYKYIESANHLDDKHYFINNFVYHREVLEFNPYLNIQNVYKSIKNLQNVEKI